MSKPIAFKVATATVATTSPALAANGKTALPRLLTVDAVAEQLGMCPKTIRRLLDRGELRKHRFGRAIRVSEEDLAVFIKMGRE